MRSDSIEIMSSLSGFRLYNYFAHLPDFQVYVSTQPCRAHFNEVRALTNTAMHVMGVTNDLVHSKELVNAFKLD